MPPARLRLTPTADPIGRLNKRLAGVGAAPVAKGRTPSSPVSPPVLLEAMRSLFPKGGREGDSSIRRGATTFDPGSGRGKFEREMRALVADVEEARASGDIDDKRADKLLSTVAKEAEGLWDEDEAPAWLANEDLRRKLIRDADLDERSVMEKVRDAPGGGALLKALDVADTGRAYALAGVLEAGDAVRAAVGKDPMGDRGNIVDSGFSLGDLKENARRRVGVGDVLEQNTLTKGLPMPVKQGLGFLGDVATDPLTYLTFGTGTAVKGAMKGASRVVGRDLTRELAEGGFRGLSKADQAAVRAAMPERAVKLLENAGQGGVKVRTPMGKVGSQGKTVIPGEVFARPARAVKASAPARAVADSAVGEGVKAVSRGLERALVPRAALTRAVGRGISDWADDMRVAMSHTAGQQGVREVDQFLHSVKDVPDLELADLQEVGRQMDVNGGGVDAVEPRLRPVYEALDGWRKRLDELNTDEGVLLGKDVIDTAREGAIDARTAELFDLFGKQADIEGKLEANRKKAPGRSRWTQEQLDDLVRASRDADIGTLERQFADEGLDVPANVREYREPGVAEGQQVGRALGRVDEAQMGARAAARDVVSAEGRAATAAGKAERAADKAVEAMDSVETQATRAAEQSLERGKKVELTNRSLNARLAKVKAQVKEAEKALDAAEVAFERSVVDVEHYLPRILTPEGYKVMKAVDEGRLRLPGAVSVRAGITGDKFVTARKPEWAGMSIQDINREQAELMQAAVDAGIIKEAGEFFDSNPVTGFATRYLAARRHIIAKQHYEGLLTLRDDAGGLVAHRLDDMPDELQDALRAARAQPHAEAGATDLALRQHFGTDEWTTLEQPKLGVGMEPQTLIVRRELKDTIQGFGDALEAPGQVGQFLDDWMKLWKGYATVPLPFGLGFHLRNAQGNVFLNWIVGMRDPKAYARALKMQLAMSRGLKQHGDPLALLAGADRALGEQALDTGVLGEGFFDIDVGRERRSVAGSRGNTALKGEGPTMRSKVNPFSTDNYLISGGRRFGGAVEHNARLAHFLWAMDTTGDALESARSVRRTLFDYGDVTKAEEKIKRFWAFYTFVRKSSPVVAGAVMRNPYLLSRIQQIRMTLAEDASDDQGGLYPGFLKEGLGVPLPIGVSKALGPLGFDPDEPVVYRPDLPGMGTADILQDLVALAGLDPDKDQREGAAGIASLVSGGGPGAGMAALQAILGRRLFGDASLSDRPIEASYPARALDKLNPFGDPLTQDRLVDGRMGPSMTQRSDFLFESLLPLFAKVPWGTRGEAYKAPRRTLSMLSGVSLYPLDEQAQDNEGYKRLDEVNRLAQGLYDQGVLREGEDGVDNALERGAVEDEVRAEFGIKPDRALTPEARAEVNRRLGK